MRIMETKVYNFSELSDKAKERAVDNARQVNVDYAEWAEFTLDHWKEQIEQAGFKNPKIYYSGFSSQGDGACFDCDYIDAEKVLPGVKIPDDVGFSIAKNSHSYHYSHAKTRYVTADTTEEITEDIRDKVNILEEIRYDLCRDLYEALEEEYTSLTSNEAVADCLTCNEDEFTEDGSRI